MLYSLELMISQTISSDFSSLGFFVLFCLFFVQINSMLYAFLLKWVVKNDFVYSLMIFLVHHTWYISIHFKDSIFKLLIQIVLMNDVNSVIMNHLVNFIRILKKDSTYDMLYFYVVNLGNTLHLCVYLKMGSLDTVHYPAL